MKWTVEYDNDLGSNDKGKKPKGAGFKCWFNVSDGKITFRTEKEDDAWWLCNLLNAKEESD